MDRFDARSRTTSFRLRFREQQDLCYHLQMYRHCSFAALESPQLLMKMNQSTHGKNNSYSIS